MRSSSASRGGSKSKPKLNAKAQRTQRTAKENVDRFAARVLVEDGSGALRHSEQRLFANFAFFALSR
jgi:hypothetical protein